MPSLTPALFVGHGNPMNAITPNRFSKAWRELGARLKQPRAILCVSAHWRTPTTEVCSADQPRTMHDFSGFPAELYAQVYPAPGAPFLAQRVQELLGQPAVQQSTQWGLDHGAWCVLRSLFPAANVPVCQLSLSHTLDCAGHLALAKQLAPLRQEGIMLIGSGNVVHNLRQLSAGPPPVWAREFDDYIAQAIERGDEAALVGYRNGPGSAMAVPTAEHYLPLLYFAGVRQPQDQLECFVDGFDLGSISMRSWVLS